MAEIQPSAGNVTTTPAAGTTTDVNVTKVNGTAVSTTNPLPVSMTGIGDSLTKGGTAAAPTSGSALLSLTANQPAGIYKVNLVYSISGAIETAGLNVRLSDSSSSFTAMDFPSNNGSVAGQVWNFTVDRLNVTSSTNTIKITAAAAAAASTVYSASLSITRIG